MTKKTTIDPAEDGAIMAFDERMSYGDYLHLDAVLGAQMPLSDAHDEMLFIVQHQTSELWMRLAIHELEAVRLAIASGNLENAFKMLARVSRIFEQLNSAWDVLRTMTPADYTTFRESLAASSGFQSYQYRKIEYMLGNRNPNLLKPHEHDRAVHDMLEAELDQPSLYEAVVELVQQGVHNTPADFEFDRRAPHQSRDDIMALWRVVYENIDEYWRLYELGEKLVDLEDYFRRWRFNHLTTVERVIGFKRGTGGTSGTAYLQRMLDVELFPELWRLRTVL